jgi:hypothetical protein
VNAYQKEKTHLSLVVTGLGLVLSAAWYLANRGSKQWQENWENHVDLLEYEVKGPLYKTVLGRPEPSSLWLLLFVTSIRIDPTAPFDLFAFLVVAMTMAAVCFLPWLGRTDDGNHEYWATQRTSKIADDCHSATADN